MQYKKSMEVLGNNPDADCATPQGIANFFEDYIRGCASWNNERGINDVLPVNNTSTHACALVIKYVVGERLYKQAWTSIFKETETKEHANLLAFARNAFLKKMACWAAGITGIALPIFHLGTLFNGINIGAYTEWLQGLSVNGVAWSMFIASAVAGMLIGTALVAHQDITSSLKNTIGLNVYEAFKIVREKIQAESEQAAVPS